MNELEKLKFLCLLSIKPNYFLLSLKIKKILFPEFNFNVESKYRADNISQLIWSKLEWFKERAGSEKYFIFG
jgi:hypothetical protein